MQDFAAPREIVWLNGAPGSGKVRNHRVAAVVRLACSLSAALHQHMDAWRSTTERHADAGTAQEQQPRTAGWTNMSDVLTRLLLLLLAWHVLFLQGVSAPHIQAVRGMTKSICVSSLLANAPEAQRYIAAGGEPPAAPCMWSEPDGSFSLQALRR